MTIRDTAGVRRLNARRVVEHLARAGTLLRAQLAERTGLSVPTVGKVVDELVASGLLEERDSTGHPGDGRLGRPARAVQLNRTTPRLIAVQLGVRHTRLASLPVAGPGQPEGPEWSGRFATPRQASTWQRRLHAAATSVAARDPWCVILSVPGVVDERSGRVLLSPNLHWSERVDLAALMRDVWNLPVILVQEIGALALGHHMAEPADRDFLLVDFGDGVGGAMVLQGRLYHGALPLQGELGHTPVGGNTRPCGCGATGCVETLVSRHGLLRSWAAAGRQKRLRTWPMLGAHIDRAGVEPWLADALNAAGRVIAGAMNVAGIGKAVVTGALSELPPVVMEALGASVRRSAMWARFGEVQVVAAPRRRAAGLAAAAMDRLLLPVDDDCFARLDAQRGRVDVA